MDFAINKSISALVMIDRYLSENNVIPQSMEIYTEKGKCLVYIKGNDNKHYKFVNGILDSKL